MIFACLPASQYMDENPDAKAAYQAGKFDEWLQEKGHAQARVNKVEIPPQQHIIASLPHEA